MKDLLVLLAHLLTTIAKLPGPGGARAVVADSPLMKQQLLVISRSRRRAPNLSALDRFLLDFWSLFLSPRRIQRAAVIIRPSTDASSALVCMPVMLMVSSSADYSTRASHRLNRPCLHHYQPRKRPREAHRRPQPVGSEG